MYALAAGAAGHQNPSRGIWRTQEAERVQAADIWLARDEHEQEARGEKVFKIVTETRIIFWQVPCTVVYYVWAGYAGLGLAIVRGLSHLLVMATYEGAGQNSSFSSFPWCTPLPCTHFSRKLMN
jgi:hypothetical protein